MSVASIWRNLRWCWSPTNRSRMARRTLYAGMTALADALSVLAPPETPITIEWPDAIRVNLGMVGGGRLELAGRRR